LRLPKKSVAPYTDSVDLVGFLKQERVVRGAIEAKADRAAKPGRAITTGDRVLVTYLQPASISKNRFGIEEDIVVEKGVNPLAFLLDAMPVAEKEVRRRGRPAKVTQEVQEEPEHDPADSIGEDA